MKRLVTGDLFAAMRVIKESNAKEALIPVLKNLDKETDAEEVGVNVILTLIECASNVKAEGAIYSFLSSPFEMTKEEVATLPLGDLVAKLKELSEENDLVSFFNALSDLIISKH